MADVEITYNNNTIVTMSSSGTEILETEGTYLTDDITIEYTKPTPTLQSKSATPTESAQTITPDSGYDGLSQVSVGAISSSYVGSNVPRQAAQTITPTTTNQTIASGKYLTGTQTIKGDVNLVAGNIKKNTSIFGVSGASTVVNVDSTTATESDVASGKVFFKADGSQATGTASGGGSQITKTTLTPSQISGGYAEIDITGFSLNDFLSIDNSFSSISYVSAILSDDEREIILYPIHIDLTAKMVLYEMYDEDNGYLFIEIYIDASNNTAGVTMEVVSIYGDTYNIDDIALIVYKET